VAIFGEKDFQQLAVIRRMVADLDFGIDIVGMPIVREADGLAMSSRNANLSAVERAAAACLSRAIAAGRDAVAAGARRSDDVLERVRGVIAAVPLARVDYIEMVDAQTMEPIDHIDRPALLALAVFVGRTRLIDNTVLAAATSASRVSGAPQSAARPEGQ
jgi:pantoate--beta-alanine ligase